MSVSQERRSRPSCGMVRRSRSLIMRRAAPRGSRSSCRASTRPARASAPSCSSPTTERTRSTRPSPGRAVATGSRSRTRARVRAKSFSAWSTRTSQRLDRRSGCRPATGLARATSRRAALASRSRTQASRARPWFDWIRQGATPGPTCASSTRPRRSSGTGRSMRSRRRGQPAEGLPVDDRRERTSRQHAGAGLGC